LAAPSANVRAVLSSTDSVVHPTLDGIRVLELGSSVAGPSAGRHLADLGAEVFKIEPPEGDGLRTWGQLSPDGTSWWFKAHNRNKRFLCFDLHAPEERRCVREIALRCDILIENFRPGRMAAWGLGYDDLRAEAPGLIYVSISGFGQDGPYAQRAGFGNIAESMGGLRHLSGFAESPPVRMGISIGDEIAGLYATIGALAALHAREATGRGDHVDVSLTEGCFSLLEGVLPEYGASGAVRERQGNRYLSAAPNAMYPTRDGKWISIGANADGIFRRFAALIGEPELAVDERFDSNTARTANSPALDAIIERWTRTGDAAELTERLNAVGVPAGTVNSIADIAADRQFAARGAIVRAPDDAGRPVTMAAPVPRFRERPSRIDSAAGAIGRDTAEILRELGLEGG
jgi:crotonobetainyl-CoA:carnitine CoA-transferase CaiB-like acyl-CoA transferase